MTQPTIQVTRGPKDPRISVMIHDPTGASFVAQLTAREALVLGSEISIHAIQLQQEIQDRDDLDKIKVKGTMGRLMAFKDTVAALTDKDTISGATVADISAEVLDLEEDLAEIDQRI